MPSWTMSSPAWLLALMMAPRRAQSLRPEHAGVDGAVVEAVDVVGVGRGRAGEPAATSTARIQSARCRVVGFTVSSLVSRRVRCLKRSRRCCPGSSRRRAVLTAAPPTRPRCRGPRSRPRRPPRGSRRTRRGRRRSPPAPPCRWTARDCSRSPAVSYEPTSTGVAGVLMSSTSTPPTPVGHVRPVVRPPRCR